MEVPDEHLCSVCDYQLKGLPLKGKCPECGNAYNMVQRVGIKFPPEPEPKLEGFDGWMRSKKVAFGLFGATMAVFLVGALSPGWAGAFFFVVMLLLLAAQIAMIVYEKITGNSYRF